MSVLSQASQLRQKRHYEEAVEFLLSEAQRAAEGSDLEWDVELLVNLRLAEYQERYEFHLKKTGAKEYAKPERLRRRFHRALKRADWQSAFEYTSILLEVEPESSTNNFLRGQAYDFLLQRADAHVAFQRGLELAFGVSMVEIIDDIQDRLAPVLGVIDETTFTTNAGKNNTGNFIHQSSGERYFTKVARKTSYTVREGTFYRDVLPQFPVIEALLPKIYHVFEVKDLIFITMELIEDEKGHSLRDGAAIRSSVAFTAVPFTSLGSVADRDLTVGLTRNPVSVQPYFVRIHEQQINKQLFHDLAVLLNREKYCSAICYTFEVLRSAFLGLGLYRYVSPESHYSLMHYDYTSANVLNSSDGAAKVIDWAGFTTGLRFIDLARYFSRRKTTWRALRENKTFSRHVYDAMSRVERIYFALAFLLQTVLISGPTKVNDLWDDTILPLLEDQITDLRATTLREEESYWVELMAESVEFLRAATVTE